MDEDEFIDMLSDVSGDDDDDDVGDDVLGDDVLGDDVLGLLGMGDAVVGGARGKISKAAWGKLPKSAKNRIKRLYKLARSRKTAIARLKKGVGMKPAWRKQLAPGVPQPGYGLEPLPLVPNLNGGIFDVNNQTIAFSAQPQAPFKPERLLASVRRTGAAGVLILANNIFVGRDLQLVELGQFDIEFFSPTAFGVRLNLVQAQPGVNITIQCTAAPAVAGVDTVAVSLMFLGHTAR